MEINGKAIEQKNFTKDCSDSQTNKNEPLPSGWTARIFAKFHARYGHKWVSAFPAGEIQDLALAEWAAGLAGYSGTEIKTGLSAWQDPWPPSLPEFMLACRPKIGPPTDTRPEWMRLPKPPADPEIRKTELEKMRKN